MQALFPVTHNLNDAQMNFASTTNYDFITRQWQISPKIFFCLRKTCIMIVDVEAV
jgi:hypothetical protein